MAKNLFDEVDRTYMGYISPEESEFNFLNRSAQENAADVRQKLECWFAKWPEDKKKDVRERFRSDDRQHHGALLELVTHEILVAIGASVEVEPEFHGMAPDFAAMYGGTSILMECTVSQDSDEDFNAAQRKGIVKRIVDSVETGHFFIEWEEPKVGKANLPGRLLRNRLQTWLAGLDPNERTQHDTFFWCHEGW